MPTPKATAIFPLYYILDRAETRCAHCARSSTRDILYSAHPIEGTTGNQLKPVPPTTSALYDVKVHTRLTTATIPFCSACIDAAPRLPLPDNARPTLSEATRKKWHIPHADETLGKSSKSKGPRDLADFALD